MSLSLKTPSFAEGALLALVMSSLGSIAAFSLSLLFFSASAISLAVILLGGGYLFYLISRSRRKSGKLVATLLVTLLLLFCTMLPLASSVILVMLLAAIWLLRSFYFRHGFLDSVFDLGLTFFGLAAAVTAGFVSESPFLAFWTFFVIQALHVYLPSMKQKESHINSRAPERFRRAHDNAKSAISRLHQSAV